MSKKRKSTRRMNKLRTEFFDEGKALDKVGDPEANCWICKIAIDYQVPANTTPESHNLDHFYPVVDYPELQEDPTNFRHSHMLCNGERGAGAPTPGLGESVPDWW